MATFPLCPDDLFIRPGQSQGLLYKHCGGGSATNGAILSSLESMSILGGRWQSGGFSKDWN